MASNLKNTRLPLDGYSRWKQLEPFMPFSRETWRQMVNEGKAPAPTYLTKRCKIYQNSEVHRFLSDPVNYRAGAA